LQIAPNVHLLPWIFAHIYLITEPGELTLIDTGFPYNASFILKFIARLGYRPSDLKRILITHADLDHVGGLERLRAATGARVAASAVEAAAICTGEVSRPLGGIGRFRGLIHAAASLVKARPAPVDEILTKGAVLPVLGGLHVMDTPGHSPGHISLWSPSSKVLFPGDSFAIRASYFKPYQGWNVWDIEQAILSFGLQAGLHPAVVCGGHRWTNRDIDTKFARGFAWVRV
jgi:glyoxylase-like metal-dependent hydrolase (beta-lactamase superfamily II)